MAIVWMHPDFFINITLLYLLTSNIVYVVYASKIVSIKGKLKKNTFINITYIYKTNEILKIY